MTVDVSVIIPIKDQNDIYIDQCLNSLRDQNFTREFEILVIKGGNRAQARNLGIKLAKGKIIAFIDSDCVAPENWLLTLVNNLNENDKLAGVGGINLSPAKSPFIGKAIDLVFSSYLGSLGSASLHRSSKQIHVNALACINSAFWLKDLRKIEGFDEKFELCEDTNLSYKVKGLGRKFLLDPNILVWHYRRDTMNRFAKQFFDYGTGRMRSILTCKKYANKGTIVPFIGCLLFPIIMLFHPLFALSFVTIYLLYILFFGIRASYKMNEIRFLWTLPSLFIIEHVTFFSGLIFGIAKGKWKKTVNCSELYIANTVRVNLTDAKQKNENLYTLP